MYIYSSPLSKTITGVMRILVPPVLHMHFQIQQLNEGLQDARWTDDCHYAINLINLFYYNTSVGDMFLLITQ